MKNILTIAIAVAAMAFFASEQVAAQGFNNGYLFGTGVNQSFIGGGSRFQAPPYFATFPPVYYNGIVRRPYGISPFAAPPGIEPVELRAIPAEIKPVTIRNPHMKSSTPMMKAKKGALKETIDKATWVKNPHFDVIDNAAYAPAAVTHFSKRFTHNDLYITIYGYAIHVF